MQFGAVRSAHLRRVFRALTAGNKHGLPEAPWLQACRAGHGLAQPHALHNLSELPSARLLPKDARSTSVTRCGAEPGDARLWEPRLGQAVTEAGSWAPISAICLSPVPDVARNPQMPSAAMDQN